MEMCVPLLSYCPVHGTRPYHARCGRGLTLAVGCACTQRGVRARVPLAASEVLGCVRCVLATSAEEAQLLPRQPGASPAAALAHATDVAACSLELEWFNAAQRFAAAAEAAAAAAQDAQSGAPKQRGAQPRPAQHPAPQPLYAFFAHGQGNLLSLVNDARVGRAPGAAAPHDAPEPANNCAFVELLLRGVPVLALVTVADVAPGQELLASYGTRFWATQEALRSRVQASDAPAQPPHELPAAPAQLPPSQLPQPAAQAAFAAAAAAAVAQLLQVEPQTLLVHLPPPQAALPQPPWQQQQPPPWQLLPLPPPPLPQPEQQPDQQQQQQALSSAMQLFASIFMAMHGVPQPALVPPWAAAPQPAFVPPWAAVPQPPAPLQQPPLMLMPHPLLLASQLQAPHAALPSAPERRSRGRPSRSGPAVCRVTGCNTVLDDGNTNCLRQRLCLPHMRADAVLLDGEAMRFCQQCKRLQPLVLFEGGKRSCAERLEQHNEKRRGRRQQLALLSGSSASAAAAAMRASLAAAQPAPAQYPPAHAAVAPAYAQLAALLGAQPQQLSPHGEDDAATVLAAMRQVVADATGQQ